MKLKLNKKTKRVIVMGYLLCGFILITYYYLSSFYDIPAFKYQDPTPEKYGLLIIPSTILMLIVYITINHLFIKDILHSNKLVLRHLLLLSFELILIMILITIWPLSFLFYISP